MSQYHAYPPNSRPFVRLAHEGVPASGEIRARDHRDGRWMAYVVYSLDVGYPDTFSAWVDYEELELVEE